MIFFLVLLLKDQLGSEDPNRSWTNPTFENVTSRTSSPIIGNDSTIPVVSVIVISPDKTGL